METSGASDPMNLPGRISVIHIDPRNRVLLWVLLLVLTVTLLLYPVRLVCEYRPIQAPYLLERLPLFATLFCIWMLLLLALAAYKRDEASKLDWESLALACVFCVVFWGFWVVITPYGSYADDVYNQAHVRWLIQEGSIPVGHENLVYFDFPGMHLLVSAISELGGSGIAASRTIFLLANIVIFSALLYTFLQRMLGSNRLTLLGVLLIVTGNIILMDKMHIFTPGALGFSLLAIFLVMLTRSEAGLLGTGVPDTLVVLVVFAAMVISYFANSFLVPLILLGIYAVQTLARDNARRPSLTIIALFAVTVLAWAAYWTWHTLQVRTEFLSKATEQILSAGFLETALRLGASNIGRSLPLWATISRLAGWAVLGLGTSLGLFNLFRVKRLSLAERTVTGALLGVVLLFLVSVFGTEGGYQFSRFLLYAPLFAVPAALLYLNRGGSPRKIALAFLTIMVFVLALPSFLSSVNTISTDAIYASDVTGGAFLESYSGDKGAGHSVYVIQWDSAALALPYVPDATIRRVPDNVLYVGSKNEVWDEVTGLVADFGEPSMESTQQKLFMINEKSMIPYRHSMGIPLDDPNWDHMKRLLSGNNRIYSGGHLEMYVPG